MRSPAFRVQWACLLVAIAVPCLTGAQPAEYDPTRPGAQPIVTPAEVRKPAEAVEPAAQAVAKSFLWEVKSPTTTAYLFGTIHVGKKSFYPLPMAVEGAINQSAKMVVEADISDTRASAETASLVMYLPPDRLDQKIPPALYERLKRQLTRLKIPQDAVKSMKPFMVGGLLSIVEFTRLGYDMNHGVDGYLIGRAQKAGKPVLELESQVAQIKMLDTMPPALQEAFLENAVSGLESGLAGEQVTGMVNAWQTGDAPLLIQVTTEIGSHQTESKALDEVLLYSRHDGMAKKIESYLASNEIHFVAVGSLHLVGPRGLVEMLRKRGYLVKQL